MVDYIKNMLKELPEDFKGTAITPAGHYLFDIKKKTIPTDIWKRIIPPQRGKTIVPC